MRRQQKGLALIVLLFAVLLGAAALLIQALRPTTLQRSRAAASDAALALAKEALLAYALTYGDFHANKLPAYLPCPDGGTRGVNQHEGSPDPPCGRKGVSVIGRLPWHQLGLEPLRDGSGECLWYAVSGGFKNDPAADMLNWDSLGQLVVMAADGKSYLAGSVPEERAAAVIFAPGEPIGGQGRASTGQTPLCGGNYRPENYLDTQGEMSNALASPIPGALTAFIAGGEGVNDRLMLITPREIFVAVQKRSNFLVQIREHLRRLAGCLAAFGTRNRAGAGDPRLPWAAPLALVDYGDNDAYADETGRLAGRLPYRVDRSRNATANGMATAELIGSSSCPPPWTAQDDEWYRNWKDHLFYAVAGAYSPAAHPPGVCGSCLSVDRAGRYAAVLLFAGAKIAGQQRSTAGDKALIANYLEERNATSYPNAAGNADYHSAATSALFDDIAYCIDTALAVAPCP